MRTQAEGLLHTPHVTLPSESSSRGMRWRGATRGDTTSCVWCANEQYGKRKGETLTDIHVTLLCPVTNIRGKYLKGQLLVTFQIQRLPQSALLGKLIRDQPLRP